jgi:hypothetical protein
LVQGGDFLPKVSRKIDIFQERMAKWLRTILST